MQTNGDQQSAHAPVRDPESLPRAGAASVRQGAASSLLRTARQALWLFLCSLVLAGQVWAIPCDVDRDGDVDLDDLNLIQKAILARAKVSGPDDPRDADGNGVTNSGDGRLCALRCTRARCATTNGPPMANAGPDQSVPLGSVIRLDGSASRDPEGATLGYTWSLIARPAGSHAALTAADSANPTFSADLPGQYVVQLIVNDGQLASAPATVSIFVTNTPPTVSLSAPAANQSFTAPATITVSAEAADSTGRITEVAFYQGGTPIGSATSAPYRITWNNVPVGTYVLKARATDSGGATTWSAKVPITVAAGGVKLYYLHHDHLNTPRLVTDEANRVVWRNTPLGEPFGMSLPEDDPDGDGQAFTLNLRFPGQYADRESNLNYNYFRDYNPEVGRYLQSDPIGLDGGINTYGYVTDPNSSVDPLGLDPWYQETMRVYTDKIARKTTIYNQGKVFEMETRNNVATGAQPGADGAYSGTFTYCERVPSTAPDSIKNAFGPLKWRTSDPRGRWIHGGGTGLPGSYNANRQGWTVTMGCTRGQNEDVRRICDVTEDFKRNNPGKQVTYDRK